MEKKKKVNKSKLLKLKNGQNIHLNQFWENKTKNKEETKTIVCNFYQNLPYIIFSYIQKRGEHEKKS